MQSQLFPRTFTCPAFKRLPLCAGVGPDIPTGTARVSDPSGAVQSSPTDIYAFADLRLGAGQKAMPTGEAVARQGLQSIAGTAAAAMQAAFAMNDSI